MCQKEKSNELQMWTTKTFSWSHRQCSRFLLILVIWRCSGRPSRHWRCLRI